MQTDLILGHVEGGAPILCHLMQRVDSLGKMLGKNEGRRRGAAEEEMVR